MPAALFTCCYSETLSPFKACSTNVGVSNYQRAVVSPGSYNTRPHSSATSSCQLAPPYIESSTDQITGIVDRELEAMFPPDLYPRLTFMEGPSFLSLVRSVVRREIADYCAPPPRIRAPCFAEYPISSAVSAPRFDRSPLMSPHFGVLRMTCRYVLTVKLCRTSRYCYRNRPSCSRYFTPLVSKPSLVDRPPTWYRRSSDNLISSTYRRPTSHSSSPSHRTSAGEHHMNQR